MFTRSIGFVALAAVVAVCAGCRISSFSFSAHDGHPYQHRPARVTHVYANEGHVCGYDCHDHYWNGTRVVVLSSGHRHGPHCGHHWSGSRWLVVGGKHAYKPSHRSHKKIKIKRRHR